MPKGPPYPRVKSSLGVGLWRETQTLSWVKSTRSSPCGVASICQFHPEITCMEPGVRFYYLLEQLCETQFLQLKNWDDDNDSPCSDGDDIAQNIRNPRLSRAPRSAHRANPGSQGLKIMPQADSLDQLLPGIWRCP